MTSAGSNYLTQQNSPLPGSGARALVPTTSIYTYGDEIAMPQLYDSTSYLPGAGNHAIQDVCGPTAAAEHFSLVVSPQAFGIALAALVHGSPVDLSKMDRAYCEYSESILLNFRKRRLKWWPAEDFVMENATLAQAFAEGVAADLMQNSEAAKVNVEPLLQVLHLCSPEALEMGG